jgi:hypothetical protein
MRGVKVKPVLVDEKPKYKEVVPEENRVVVVAPVPPPVGTEVTVILPF